MRPEERSRITVEPDHLDGKPCIRRLPITVWVVYKDLAFHGLTEEAVLKKYPDLEPEDLTAVRAYIASEIKSRTSDEFTGRPILPKDQLKHGRFYKGRCRNATVARWNVEENCFYHWREKFGRIFIETIKYPTDETEPWWDVFDVVEELPWPKFEIPFDHEAVFAGNRDDLYEHNEEMWHRPKK